MNPTNEQIADLARVCNAWTKAVRLAEEKLTEATKLDELESSNAQLLQHRLEQAEQDAKRLDWLAEHHLEFAKELNRLGWVSSHDAQWEKLKLFLRRLRQYIDSAMKETKS
jgi:hypothetical protein